MLEFQIEKKDLIDISPYRYYYLAQGWQELNDALLCKNVNQ